jgi:uncharacterized protein YdcH (DUF465 family)
MQVRGFLPFPLPEKTTIWGRDQMATKKDIANMYWLEEIKVYRNALLDRISALNNAIERLEKEKKNLTLAELFKMWRNRLMLIARDANDVIEEGEHNRMLLASLKACSLKDKIYNLLAEVSPKDPVYNNVKIVIINMLTILESLCNKS